MRGFSVLSLLVTLLFLSASGLKQSELRAINPKIDRLYDTFKSPSGWYLPATVLRLAFHDAGTYSVDAKNGGPHGVQYFNCVRGQTICEQNNPDNSGLAWAIDALEKVYREHKFDLSRADFWQLAAIRAIKYTGGPSLEFKWGRLDYTAEWSQLGRLPGSQGDVSHLRKFMGDQLGINDRDIVALMGGHTLGSMHTAASGHLFPWDDTERKFDNRYFKSLIANDWSFTNSNGGQFQARRGGKTFAMLNTDMALKRVIGRSNSPSPLAPIVQEFANSEAAFFEAFAQAWEKVTSNGAKLREVCGDDDPTCFFLPPALPPKPAFKVTPPPKGTYYGPKPKPITYYAPAPTPRTGYVPPSNFPVPRPIPVPKPVPVPRPIPVPVAQPEPVPVPRPVPVPVAVPRRVPVPGDLRVTTTGEPVPKPVPVPESTGSPPVPRPIPVPVVAPVVDEPLPLTAGQPPSLPPQAALPVTEFAPVAPQPVIGVAPIPLGVVDAPPVANNIVDDLPPLEGLRTEDDSSSSGGSGTPGWVFGVVAVGVVAIIAVVVLSVLVYKKLARPMETV